MAVLPYRPPSEAMEAKDFLRKMARQDEMVAKLLKGVQEKNAKRVNEKKKEPPVLQPGSKVWYFPERQPGTDKLEVRGKGPGVVLEQVGKHSYVVELKPGGRQHAYRSQLRPHISDEYSGPAVPLYFCSKTTSSGSVAR